jgi:hypothetical protein
MVANAAVVYWRFLYEQCGGMSGHLEDPGAGMRVVQAAFDALYSNHIVNIAETADVTGSIPEVMDQALSRTPACPFDTYEESLESFASAVYALRLEGGRCKAPSTPEGCGLYDPQGLYLIEPPRTITYSGTEQGHSSSIYSSYGMDFLEVAVDADGARHPLVIEFEGAADGRAEFNVQAWRLIDGERGSPPRSAPERADGPQMVGFVSGGRRVVYTVPAIDLDDATRLAIIIVRVDPNENLDPAGEYTIDLRPA